MALQGAFIEHEQMLKRLAAETFEVRQQSDWLSDKDGLPVFATCAGLILLARQEDGRPREGLSTMDIDVCRNAYGRQLGSFQTVGQVKGIEGDFPMTFIRAPYIHRTLSPNVEILSVKAGHIVAVQQGRQLATAFHPELTSDDRLHRYFHADI